MSRPADSLRKHGWEAEEYHVVTDTAGRIVGRYKTPIRPCLEEVEIVRQFLITIQKNRIEENRVMSKTEDKKEKTNMVYLAGTLKLTPKQFENTVSCLIDVGQKSALQCSVYTGENAPEGNDQIARKLKAFQEGDFIKVVCMLRPYGVKKGDTWKNSISIDITAIKTDPPRRQESRRPADDDIPF